MSDRIATDDLFEALTDRHRRQVMVRLLEGGSRAELNVPDDLGLGETERNIHHIAMVHLHLPKLQAMGIIEWERKQGTATISRGPRFDEIRPYLQTLHENRDELPADWL